MEGVLASFPDRLAGLDVQRIAWPRPRPEIVALLGEENQSLPVLVLADDAPDDLATGRFGALRFVNDKDAILHTLSVRYGIPVPHP